MMATWFRGRRCVGARKPEGFANRARIAHFLGGTSIECAGNRAIARGPVRLPKVFIFARSLSAFLQAFWGAL